MTPSLETFAEAVSVVPAIYVTGPALKVLTVGPYALPLAKLMLRYPETVEVACLDADTAPLPSDRRVMATMPPSFVAHVACVAVTGDPMPVVTTVAPRLDPDGVLCVALDQFSRGRAVKDGLQNMFKHVVPYREYLPQAALFLLASNRPLGKPSRPFPQGLRRLTPRYLSNLFTLAKDEYLSIYGANHG